MRQLSLMLCAGRPVSACVGRSSEIAGDAGRSGESAGPGERLQQRDAHRVAVGDGRGAAGVVEERVDVSSRACDLSHREVGTAVGLLLCEANIG